MVIYFQGRPVMSGTDRGGLTSAASSVCSARYPGVPAALRLVLARANLAAALAALVGKVLIPFWLIISPCEVFSQKNTRLTSRVF